jgi:hypothetical protein
MFQDCPPEVLKVLLVCHFPHYALSQLNWILLHFDCSSLLPHKLQIASDEPTNYSTDLLFEPLFQLSRHVYLTADILCEVYGLPTDTVLPTLLHSPTTDQVILAPLQVKICVL